jgi:transcriptional regulator with XRE-family HTH domain
MAYSLQAAAYRRFLVRLREARQAAGLTQEQVAEALGKPQSWVSKCESGERRVDALELNMLANAYGISMDSLFEP